MNLKKMTFKTLHFQMADESRAESPVLEKRQATNNCSSIHIILSIIVVLLAIGGSYLFTIQDDEPAIELEDPLDEGQMNQDDHFDL